MTKLVVTEKINEGREEHDFGVFDKKGRAIGARLFFRVEVYAESRAPNLPGSWVTEPGTYYVLITQSLRAGEPYGAWTPPRHFKTEAERIAAAAKYLKGAKSRAIKNAA